MARFWIFLVKVSQGFEYASSSKYVRARNMASKILSMQGLQRVCLNMCEYALIMLDILEYASISSIYLNNAWICSIICSIVSLNMPEHCWTLLNVPEYTWECPSKLFCICQCSQYSSSCWIYARVLNMPQIWICQGSKYAVIWL